MTGYRSLMDKLLELQSLLARKAQELKAATAKNQVIGSCSKTPLTPEELDQLSGILKEFDSLAQRLRQLETELGGMRGIFEKIADGSLM